jgi:hypothetical protein
MAPAVHDAQLRRLLEKGLAERNGGPVSVSSIERHPFDRATSYALELLHVHLGAGDPLILVIKNFGSSQLPKDDPASRAEREATVYRDLLDGLDVGTPRLYGIAAHPVRLLLEYVDGTTLKHHGLATWRQAATWLGAFQAQVAHRCHQVDRCQMLIRHDAAFFLARARAARRAITAFGPAAARRLAVILDGYGRLVEVMADQPRTLVHGSFRPQNIVVSIAGDASVRICPVDWELAGLGSPLHDLAFLAEGFHGADLDLLFAAYLNGLGRADVVAPTEMAFTVDCFRLHKIVKSVSDSVTFAFRPATIDKLLAMAEDLRDRLG